MYIGSRQAICQGQQWVWPRLARALACFTRPVLEEAATPRECDVSSREEFRLHTAPDGSGVGRCVCVSLGWGSVGFSISITASLQID